MTIDNDSFMKIVMELDKLPKRIKELENDYFSKRTVQHDLDKALSAIQKEYKEMFDSLEAKITELGNELNIVRALGCRKFVYRSPHKCPVCEGSGKDKNKLVAEPYDQTIKILVAPACHSCEGKGIVWG